MSAGKILVIDDEQVMCDLLSELLKDKGYEVDYVLSGKEGINLTKEGNFDVVLVDLKMPDIDGIQVLAEIKKFDSDTVVIVITGYPSFETVQESLRLGAYDYIAKPFGIEEISFVIKRGVDFRNLVIANKKLMKDLEEQNIRLDEKVRERTKEISTLYSIGREVSSILKLDEVLETVVNRISEILDLEICSILLLDKDSDELSIKSARGLTEDIIKQTKLKRGEKISGWILGQKKAVLVDDIETDPRFARRNQEKYYNHSFISVPLIVKGETIGVININNKRSKEPLSEDDFRLIKGIAVETSTAIENARLYKDLQDTYMRTITALTSAIDAKDHYTRSHSEHVTKYAVAIAKEMGFSKSELDELEQACQLHDLGKIGIHDYILTKPGKLTPEEWEEIKLHSLKSVEILKPLTFLGGVIDLIRQHHERIDGKGYPNGQKGEEIKLGAKIMAVADAFDAMTTERPYRKARPLRGAIEELKRYSGSQFDPKVVEVFLMVLEKNVDIVKLRYKK